MNEDLNGGTPNPLNPAPTEPISPAEGEQPVVPIEPTPAEPVAPAEPVEVTMATEVTETVTEPVAPVAPASAVPAEPAEPVAPASAVPAEPTEPVAPAPVEANPTLEPSKKSHKKLGIILAVVFLLIAIGCAVAAIIILKPFGGRDDAVPSAISKLISNPPKNVAIDGTVTLSDNSGNNSFKTLTVDFNTNMNTKTSENTTEANLVAVLADDSEFTFKVSEIRTSDGSLYMKPSGLMQALSGYTNPGPAQPGGSCDPTVAEDCEAPEGEPENAPEGMPEGEPEEAPEMPDGSQMPPETDCEDATNCGPAYTQPSIFEFLGLLDVVDNEWILFQDSTFSNVTATTKISESTQCVIDAAGKLGEYGDDLAAIYKQNPFMTYSTDNIKIAKKKNTIYKIVVDNDKLADFINAISNSGFTNELYSCMGYGAISSNVTVTAENLTAITSLLPDIYVEIDDDDNFTRAVLSMTNPDQALAVTADLSFSYPTTSVTIEEPTDYVDATTVLLQAFNILYGVNVVTTE